MAASAVASLPARELPASASLPVASLAARVPHLDVLALAGRGSFGEVWLVQDRQNGQLRALKQVRDDCSNPRAARQLLLNEFEVGQRVSSAHVVAIVGEFFDAEPPCLLFEWLSGETLESRLNRERQLSCAEALWIARQAAQGLVDLLRAGLTHGDLKPSNIFLCRSGAVKLIDLGFARPDQRIIDDLDDATRVVAGTLEYLAPEALANCEQTGIGRDLYSLGVTFYRMLTGRLPFQGTSPSEIARRHQQSPVHRLRKLAPHVSSQVEDLVHRLLSKQPLRRGAGPRSLVQELIDLELSTLEFADA